MCLGFRRYDMYAGETRAGTSANPDLPGGQHPSNEPMPESTQQAVEVVELANGEIIWCVCLVVSALLLNYHHDVS